MSETVVENEYGSRYDVAEKIGAGGMADVYKGVDKVLGRTVAIKVLHQRLASDATFAARFRQEAQSAANLSSPHIVQVYDWGKTGDTYFIVMEFVRGTDLKSIISEEGSLPAGRIAEIGAQVASALTVAHNHDVIHRDVKPHNIMVQPDGTVKVMDFGIARAGNTTMTQTGSVLGTAHYVSPEQAQGKKLTAASDVYSLGVVLYEAATGRLPFDADTPVAVALKQVNEEPQPPREINPAIPPALQNVILKAMAKNPEDRYPTAEAMRQDLLAVGAGKPVAAPAPAARTAVMPTVPSAPAVEGARRRTEPAKKKNRTWIWILVAALLLAAGLAAAFALGAFNPSKLAVPELEGRTETQARALLAQQGLAVGIVRREFDPQAKAGTVISQDPGPGTQVEKGTKVDFVISRGTQKVEVPDVVGQTDTEAAQVLQDAGFQLTLPTQEFSSKPTGTVLSQDPEGGSKAPKGSSVTLTVSKGPETIEVPEVEGRSRNSAVSELQGKGFDVKVVEEYSSTVKNGIVISQNPSPGLLAYKGVTVTITVSKGEAPVSVPNVIGKTEAEARSILQDAGFAVKVVTKEDPSDGIVLSQDPGVDRKAQSGSTVTITVGKAPTPPTPGP